MRLKGWLLEHKQASDDLLHNKIRKYDILVLVETQKHSLDNVHHPLGYFNNFVYRKNFNKKPRPFRDILAYYRSELHEKVSAYAKSSENIIWVKIDKSVNGYENNIFVACFYNSPNNSRYTSFKVAMLLIGQ